MAFSLNLPYPICLRCARLMRRVRPPRPGAAVYDPAEYFQNQYDSTDRLRRAFMGGLALDRRVILDVGSGLGGRSPYWLEQGAARVANLDINREELNLGRKILARKFPELAPRIEFCHPDDYRAGAGADLAILFDCFEHLTDPAAVLRQVDRWVRPGGQVWIGSFGWYHYNASHCLGHVPIPWCQVLFSERAIIRTIQTIVREPGYVPNYWERTEGITRWDRVRTLKDRPGEPLNMLSLRRIRQILAASPFRLEQFRVYPFSGSVHPAARVLSGLTNLPVLQEFFHSYYTATLIKPG